MSSGVYDSYALSRCGHYQGHRCQTKIKNIFFHDYDNDQYRPGQNYYHNNVVAHLHHKLGLVGSSLPAGIQNCLHFDLIKAIN